MIEFDAPGRPVMLGVVAVICHMRERKFASKLDVFDDRTRSID